MILIIGGAYQGKKEFLMRHWKITQEQIADMAQPEDTAGMTEGNRGPAGVRMKDTDHEIRAVINYQEAVRAQLELGLDPAQELKKLIGEKPDIILLANEVGMGIVPVDRRDRDFREAAGRTLCLAARMADEVWRVICGIEERIR